MTTKTRHKLTSSDDNITRLDDINIRDIGNSIQITGLIFSSNDLHYITFLPGEDMKRMMEVPATFLDLNLQDWSAVLHQSDVLEIEMQTETKAIVRKSQRQIETAISWDVFARDHYGGASVAENLLSSCKQCNRKRGSMPYEDWMRSAEYNNVNGNLTFDEQQLNLRLIERLPELRRIKQAKRSR